MNDTQGQAWARLNDAALHALSHPLDWDAPSLPKSVRPRLHLWTYPSFDVHVGFVIAEPLKDAHEGIVRRIWWNPDEDQERVMQRVVHTAAITPTIRVRDTAAPPELVQEVLKSVTALQFAPFTFPRTFGADGEQYGAEAFGSFAHARVSWWSAYEPQLEPLVRWHQSTWSLLDTMDPVR